MGSYNTLITDIKCSNCNASFEGKIQFRYGNTVQLKYRIGDKVEWGGNQIGHPNERKVKVYGILESEQCPVCGKENENNEFDIFVENRVLVSVSVMQKYDYEGEGNYMVLEN